MDSLLFFEMACRKVWTIKSIIDRFKDPDEYEPLSLFEYPKLRLNSFQRQDLWRDIYKNGTLYNEKNDSTLQYLPSRVFQPLLTELNTLAKIQALIKFVLSNVPTKGNKTKILKAVCIAANIPGKVLGGRPTPRMKRIKEIYERESRTVPRTRKRKNAGGTTAVPPTETPSSTPTDSSKRAKVRKNSKKYAGLGENEEDGALRRDKTTLELLWTALKEPEKLEAMLQKQVESEFDQRLREELRAKEEKKESTRVGHDTVAWTEDYESDSYTFYSSIFSPNDSGSLSDSDQSDDF